MKLENVKIAVIGQGYVGLPLAIEFGKKYYTVGFDINSKRIEELKEGDDYTKEVSKEQLGEEIQIILQGGQQGRVVLNHKE